MLGASRKTNGAENGFQQYSLEAAFDLPRVCLGPGAQR